MTRLWAGALLALVTLLSVSVSTGSTAAAAPSAQEQAAMTPRTQDRGAPVDMVLEKTLWRGHSELARGGFAQYVLFVDVDESDIDFDFYVDVYDELHSYLKLDVTSIEVIGAYDYDCAASDESLLYCIVQPAGDFSILFFADISPDATGRICNRFEVFYTESQYSKRVCFNLGVDPAPAPTCGDRLVVFVRGIVFTFDENNGKRMNSKEWGSTFGGEVGFSEIASWLSRGGHRRKQRSMVQLRAWS
jgi:hypothetical protein